MGKGESRDLHALMKDLQEFFPNKHKPVRLRVVHTKNLKGNHGLTIEEDDFFDIRVANMSCFTCMRDTLFHEYAHTLIRTRGGEMVTKHNAKFWTTYGAIVDQMDNYDAEEG